ncbi:MAG: T9SS type A sorting domain-containing protein [Bacteroidetes bacterium]|nr:MAG: T9SS type A sorting domain-containing protein [Bacteroidota bacterium]
MSVLFPFRKVPLLLSASLLYFSMSYGQGYIWSNHIGHGVVGELNIDVGKSIVVMEDGTHYVAGASDGGFLGKFDADGNEIWSSHMSSVTNGLIDISQIVADADGNVYMVGIFELSIKFKTGSGTIELTGSGQDQEDIFVAKFNPQGKALWARGAVGSGRFSAYQLALDKDNNVYVPMNIKDIANINAGGGNTVNVDGIDHDIFLVKYDSDGNYLSNTQFASFNSKNCRVIEIDDLGRIYLGGRAFTFDIDPGPDQVNVNNCFLARFSSDMTLDWAFSLSGSWTAPFDIEIGSDYSMYVGGTSGTTYFDYENAAGLVSPRGSTDAFVAKYDSLGKFLWVAGMGGDDQSSEESVRSLKVDQHGQVACIGTFSADNFSDFDPGPDTLQLPGKGLNDIFYVTLDSLGQLAWAGAIGASNSDQGYSIGIDQYENIYGTGAFLFTADFDLGADTKNMTANGSADLFISKYCLHPPRMADSIAGGNEACRGFSKTFSTIGLFNADSYEWTVPAGATISSGQGSNTITVLFGSSAQDGVITVKGINPCGSGKAYELAVTIINSPPIQPSNLSGTFEVCQGTAGIEFQVDPMTDILGYEWTLPDGANITQGDNSNHITVHFTKQAISGNVSVAAINGCGTGTPISQSIQINPLPVQTVLVSMPDRVCAGDTVNVTCESEFADTYTWSIPGAWVIVGSDNQASAQIVMNESPALQFSVKGTNSCGDGTSKTFPVFMDTEIPGKPGEIVGTESICAPDGTFGYSINAVSGASSYQWNLPPNTTLVSGGGTSVQIDYPENAESGTIEVSASNACGASEISSIQINVGQNPVTPVITQQGDSLLVDTELHVQWYDQNGEIVGATLPYYIPAFNGFYYCIVDDGTCFSEASNEIEITTLSIDQLNNISFRIAPNPASDECIVQLKSVNKHTRINLRDISGKSVSVPIEQIGNSTYRLSLQHLRRGIYLIELNESGRILISQKLIKL